MENEMKEIIDVLTKFQQGYDESDLEQADLLMADLFSKRDDLLTYGTGTYEACLGREQVKELIKNDWDGGWGGFKLDLPNAKIEIDGDIAWFFLDATVKYEFKDADADEFGLYNGFVKEIIANEKNNAKQKLSFLNWALGMQYHQRPNGEREYLWPSEFSGMMVKEDGNWKIMTMHFAMAKPNYPTERLEETIEEYQNDVDFARNKMIEHTTTKIDDELFAFLTTSETGVDFVKEQVAVFTAGNFSWLMAIATERKVITEEAIFANAMSEIEQLANSAMSEDEKLFATKRSIAFALREVASGSEFTWTIKLTAVIEKTADGYQFRQKHYSYPFNWYFEGLY